MTLPYEEEFKQWIEEQKERVNYIMEHLEDNTTQMKADTIAILIEKSVPPFHYWLQDKQKQEFQTADKMFEDNRGTTAHIVVKDGASPTYPRRDMFRQMGFHFDKILKGWTKDLPTAQFDYTKRDMEQRGFYVEVTYS